MATRPFDQQKLARYQWKDNTFHLVPVFFQNWTQVRLRWPLKRIASKCSFLSWVIKLSLAALSRNIFTKWRRYANKNERSKSAITKRFGTLSSSSAAGWKKKATIFFLRKSPTCTNFVAARDKFFLFVSAEFFKGVLLGQPSYRGRPTVSAIGFAQPSLCWRRSYCFNPFVYFILFPICYLAAESLPVWG